MEPPLGVAAGACTGGASAVLASLGCGAVLHRLLRRGRGTERVVTDVTVASRENLQGKQIPT